MNKVNFLKWQMLSRLPKGSIYERVIESIKNKDLSVDNPFYYIYWLDLDYSPLKKFILGTFGTTNEDYYKFISWLERFRINDFYYIPFEDTFIKIPVPSFEDYKCFKAEFLDIIMPSFVGNGYFKQPFLEGPYEYGCVTLEEKDTVIDCGANYGLFSSLAAAKGCEVHAFEPTKRVFEEYLKRLASKEGRVLPINMAVSDKSGTQFFEIDPQNTSCNHLIDEGSILTERAAQVRTTSIDDYANDHLSTVDFIKADIEGAERLMLDGAREVLKEYAPKLAICYYHKLDDLRVLTKKILEANPHYEIDVEYRKIYAHDPRRTRKR